MGNFCENRRRVFFALWPEPSMQKELAAWQAPLRQQCGGRAMQTETLHCTLVFLGEVEAPRLEALTLAAQEVVMEPFSLRFREARYWGHNHIVYAAPEQVPEALQAMVSNLERSLHHHHFQFDAREYKPHVTLLRNAQWHDVPLPPQPPVDWVVRQFVLVESIRDASAAHYEMLENFGNGGNA